MKYELRKILSWKLVLCIAILFLVPQIILIVNLNGVKKGGETRHLYELSKNLEGMVTKENSEYVQNLYDDMIETLSIEKEMEDRYNNSDISDEEYRKYRQKYRDYSAKKGAITILYERYSRCEELNCEYVFDSYYNEALNPKKIPWFLFAIVLLFSVMLSIADVKNTMVVPATTKKGIKTVHRNKCKLIIIFILTTTIVSSLLEIAYLKIFDGINEWNIGIASVPVIYDNGFHMKISIGGYILLMILFKCVVSLVLGVGVFFCMKQRFSKLVKACAMVIIVMIVCSGCINKNDNNQPSENDTKYGDENDTEYGDEIALNYKLQDTKGSFIKPKSSVTLNDISSFKIGNMCNHELEYNVLFFLDGIKQSVEYDGRLLSGENLSQEIDLSDFGGIEGDKHELLVQVIFDSVDNETAENKEYQKCGYIFEKYNLTGTVGIKSAETVEYERKKIDSADTALFFDNAATTEEAKFYPSVSFKNVYLNFREHKGNYRLYVYQGVELLEQISVDMNDGEQISISIDKYLKSKAPIWAVACDVNDEDEAFMYSTYKYKEKE